MSKLKELYNVKSPPNQYVVRAVVDKAADSIESTVASRLGFPLDYAEVRLPNSTHVNYNKQNLCNDPSLALSHPPFLLPSWNI